MQNMWLLAKSKLIALPSECKKLILLNALFQGGRLFVGAVCVLYFLSFGLKSEDYAWIKTTQAMIFIGLDIPLGYLLNRIGEYKSLLLAFAFGVIGASGYLIFSSFLGFLISEIFLALSLSIWPVALSAYAMRVLGNYKIDGLVEKFFHFGDATSNLFIVICGSLGGLLYVFNKYIPYGCFLVFYLFAALLTLLHLKDIGVVKAGRKEKIDFVISNIKEISSILPFAFILFLVQFFMQPLFHYWQPLFTEKFLASSENMSIAFAGYSLAMSIISWGYSQMTYLPILRSNLFIVSAALLASVMYSLLARLNTFSSSLIFFALTFGIFNLVQIAGGVLIQNRLKKENRMIITKYISFFSRVGMIISLIFLHSLFSNGWETSKIYKFYGIFAMIIFCFYLGWMTIRKNSEMTHVFNSKY